MDPTPKSKARENGTTAKAKTSPPLMFPNTMVTTSKTKAIIHPKVDRVVLNLALSSAVLISFSLATIYSYFKLII
jgi:hypothetical protein